MIDKITLNNRANLLKTKNTSAERLMWLLLRRRQFFRFKFRRQYVISPFIVDFVCLWKRLIIEVDGSLHEETVQYDRRRTAFLESKGFRVLRFWNHQILSESPVVMETILVELLRPPLPRLPP